MAKAAAKTGPAAIKSLYCRPSRKMVRRLLFNEPA